MPIALLFLFMMYVFKQKGMNSAVYMQGKRVSLIGIIIFAVLFSSPFFIHPTILLAARTTAVSWAAFPIELSAVMMIMGKLYPHWKKRQKLTETSAGSEFHWSSSYQVLVANFEFNQWLWIQQIILQNSHCRKFVKTEYYLDFCSLIA